MSDFCPPATSFVLHRSYFNVINEMDSNEEKLAAFMTLCQMAFQGEEAFSLPEIPVGGKMTPMLHAVRNIYHQSRDFIWQKAKPKNEKNVAAGKKGGRPRKYALTSDSMAETDEEEMPAPMKAQKTAEKAPTSLPKAQGVQLPKDDLSALLPPPTSGATANPIGGPDIIDGVVQSRFASIIKSPSDLKAWLKQNWYGGKIDIVLSDGFSTWAYEQLVNSGWRSYKTNKPIANLSSIVSKLTVGYEKYVKFVLPKIKAEEEEHKRQEEEKKREELTEADLYEIRRKRLEKAEPYE